MLKHIAYFGRFSERFSDGSPSRKIVPFSASISPAINERSGFPTSGRSEQRRQILRGQAEKKYRIKLLFLRLLYDKNN